MKVSRMTNLPSSSSSTVFRSSAQNIPTYIRIRPEPEPTLQKLPIQINASHRSIQIHIQPSDCKHLDDNGKVMNHLNPASHVFHYDYVLDEEASQQKTFETCASHTVQDVLHHDIDGTILLYGQVRFICFHVCIRQIAL